MIRDQIVKDCLKSLKTLGFDEITIEVGYPAREEYGDYSSNIAMVLANKAKKNPVELAKSIVASFPKTDYLEKIEVAPPGFLNFWLKTECLGKQIESVLKQKESFGQGDLLADKKIMVEYGDPNTHKAFHIGHLRNISLGESLTRLLEAEKARVIHASYQGDVGMHIAKCLYGLLHNNNLLAQIKKIEDIQERINLIAQAYTEGSKVYEEDDRAKKEIALINKQIYIKDLRIWDLYKTTRQWSLDYFEGIYKRLNTHYDKQYFESQVYELGKENVLIGLRNGIFIESKGAIIFPGEKYGLHNRVFITAEGNPTYEGKDMALGPLQYKESGRGFVIRVVGPEQAGYFQVVFEAQSQLFPELRGKFIHLASGWVKLKRGKMSSRTGQVVLGEWLLDEVKSRLKKNYKMDDTTAEVVAVGAVKYSMLKVSATQEIVFDIDESINLEGDSGPYLQYTYARSASVLRRAEVGTKIFCDTKGSFLKNFVPPRTPELEEMSLLRTLYRFPEVVADSAKTYSPNLICQYLFDLAKKYNLFYNQLPILKAKGKERQKLRLALTAVTAQVVKNGLWLLGIGTLEKM